VLATVVLNGGEIDGPETRRDLQFLKMIIDEYHKLERAQ
jgi:hypothetical protein